MSLVNTIQSKLKPKFGLICLIAAQLCICINIVASKHLIKNTPALVLLTLRFFLGALFLYGYLQSKNKKLSLKVEFNKLCIRSKISIIAQGLLGGFFFNILLVTGLKLTTATMAGILSSLLPTLIIIFSYFILKEKVSKNEIFSIIIATIGIVFINITKFSQTSLGLNILGDLLILLSLFPEALYTIVAKIQPVDICPLTNTTIINIINFIAFFTTLVFFTSDIYYIKTISFTDWFLIISLLASAGLLFFVLWSIGLKHSTTQQAGIVTAVVPAGSCLLAVVFLHESIHYYELIGICLIIFAIYIGTIKTGKKSTKSDQKLTSLNNLEDLDSELAIDSNR